MKKMLYFGLLLCAHMGFSQTLYTADGSLTANRTVTLGGKSLNFVPATGSPAVGNLFINGTSGNIGLGTTSPSSRFHINSGDFKLTSGKFLLGTTPNDNDTYFNWGMKTDKPIFIANSTTPVIKIFSTAPGVFGFAELAVATTNQSFSQNASTGDVVLRGFSYSDFIVTNEAGGTIKFATKEADLVGVTAKIQMTIDKMGNVGVGTETPDSKLAVNGLIHAKEVRVDLLGWPDYVFKKDYKLLDLKEVEQQIEATGHLPNVPSATEVEANGLQLGAMNKVLMEKVEELTLYIIALDKKLEALEAQLKK